MNKVSDRNIWVYIFICDVNKKEGDSGELREINVTLKHALVCLS